jgi:hypothetical protein
MHGSTMSYHTIIARILGHWQEFHDASRTAANKWGAYTTACAVIATFSLASFVFSFAPWWSLPLTITATAISWALWWPMNCATWFGWVGMLFRLVSALGISTVAWFIGAVMK